MERPDWNRYFIDIAKLVATRSTCIRRSVGAVIVKEKRLIATGYNGAPAGLKHCDELGGCLRQKLGIPSGERHEICRATHAEQNAIIQAARHGSAIEGSDLYCTHQPCSLCAKMIINAGIRRIFFIEGYPDDFALSFIKEAGIELTKIDPIKENA